MLTPKQVAWAAQHDWFSRELRGFLWDEPTGRIEVIERYTVDGVMHEQVRIWDGTFRELRAWAGY